MIIRICLILNHFETDIFQALESLMTSGEPREIISDGVLVQTVRHSTYALFCLFKNLRLKRNVELDSVFEFRHLSMKFFSGDELGRVKSSLIPFGLIAMFVRLHVESQIDFAKLRLIIIITEKPNEELVLEGSNIFLKNDENRSLVRLVNSVHFPPLNMEINSVLGEFYLNISKVLNTLKTSDLVEMGLPNDVCHRLNVLVQSEEDQFLRDRGLFINETDSVQEMVLDMFRDKKTEEFVCPTPLPFNIFHDSQRDRNFDGSFELPDFEIKRINKVDQNIQKGDSGGANKHVSQLNVIAPASVVNEGSNVRQNEDVYPVKQKRVGLKERVMTGQAELTLPPPSLPATTQSSSLPPVSNENSTSHFSHAPHSHFSKPMPQCDLSDSNKSESRLNDEPPIYSSPAKDSSNDAPVNNEIKGKVRISLPPTEHLIEKVSSMTGEGECNDFDKNRNLGEKLKDQGRIGDKNNMSKDKDRKSVV